MSHWAKIRRALDRDGRVAAVTIVEALGSSPREPGARMIVHVDGSFHGTIGGGTLEWQALAEAQAGLHRGVAGWSETSYALGPDLGQCCGGRVIVGFEYFDASRLSEVADYESREAAGGFVTRSQRPAGGTGTLRRAIVAADSLAATPELPPSATLATGSDRQMTERFGAVGRTVLIFGAGHVGRALVLALAPLPFRVLWIDPRPEAFPAHVPGNVTLVRPDDPVAAVAAAAPGALVLVMTHSHALDLALVDAALRRDVFPYVGVIGSATKRARFSRRLAEMGHGPEAVAAMVCPIGAGGPVSKLPAAIAASVAVELLVADETASAVSGADGAGAGPADAERPIPTRGGMVRRRA